MKYTFVDALSDGLVGLKHQEHGRCLWTARKLRKHAICAACGKQALAGSTAYGPLTNGYNRMDRICKHCVETWLLSTDKKNPCTLQKSS